MIKRTIKKQILNSIKYKPVTLITGARQVGKSTLCYEISKELNFNYVSLDDIKERQLAISDPIMFLQLHQWPLIIDEVQYAPKLFDVIESIVNKQKLTNGNNQGMYVLAGSQSFELMKNVTESLAGRVGIIKMQTLSSREIFGVNDSKILFDINDINSRSKDYDLNINKLLNLITKGFYPELYDSEIDKNFFYSNYVKTYIERDVSEIINIKDKLKFQNFLELLASLTGKELVYDNIAKIIGVKSDTIKAWVSVLVSSDIIYLLQPYNEISIAKRIVKRPKIYFCDTGLACFLVGLNEPEVLRKSYFLGSFVETYIINEFRKSLLNNGIYDSMYYYRDTNQNEIDLIILENGQLHLIECKTGVEFNKTDIKSFKNLNKTKYQIGESYIICNTETIYKIDSNVFVIPITSI